MGDERLRELERRFRETGAVDDEAAWLRERVRSGQLIGEALVVAAYANHAGARRALADEAPAMPTDARAWLSGLRDYSKEWSVRAAIAIARTWLSTWESNFAGDDTARAAIEAAEAWLVHPCDAHARAARARYELRPPNFEALLRDADWQWRGAAPDPTQRRARLRRASAVLAALEAAQRAARAAAEPDARRASAQILHLSAVGEDTRALCQRVLIASALGSA